MIHPFLTGQFSVTTPLFPLIFKLLALFIGHFHESGSKRSMVAEMLMNSMMMPPETEPESTEQNAA